VDEISITKTNTSAFPKKFLWWHLASNQGLPFSDPDLCGKSLIPTTNALSVNCTLSDYGSGESILDTGILCSGVDEYFLDLSSVSACLGIDEGRDDHFTMPPCLLLKSSCGGRISDVNASSEAYAKPAHYAGSRTYELSRSTSSGKQKGRPWWHSGLN
jgi:hypothetical protein